MTMNTYMSVSFEFSFNSFDTFLCSAAPFRLNWLVFVFVTFNEALQLKAFSVLQTTNQTHYMNIRIFFQGQTFSNFSFPGQSCDIYNSAESYLHQDIEKISD